MKARKWSEVIDSLKLNIVRIAWNSTGAEALALLREKCGAEFPELSDPGLDETAGAFEKQSTDVQLNALGSCMQKQGLRFGYLCMSQDVYNAFIVRCENTKEFMMKWKEILTRRQFFSGVQTLAFRSEEEFDSYEDIVAFPYSSKTVRSEIESEGGSTLERYGDYLVNIIENPVSSLYPPVVHVFDLHRWPAAEVEASASVDDEYIEPACISFKSLLGKDEKIVGRSFRRMKLITDQEEDSEESNKVLWRGGAALKDIPSIKNADPVLVLDDRVIYCYQGEFIGAEKNTGRRTEDRTERSRRFRDDEEPFCLIEYNTSTQKYRMKLFPNFTDQTELYFYDDEWILLRQNEFRSNSSYVFRLWNPDEDVFLRMPFGLMRESELEEIEKLGDGSIAFRMNDGRLIKPEVNLVEWLSARQQPEKLPDWSDEQERRYEGFKEDNRRSFRIRRYSRSEIADRYIVKFCNSIELYIEINKDN